MTSHSIPNSALTSEREQVRFDADAREAQRERFAPDCEPSFPGETLQDALLRAALKLEAVAKSIHPESAAREWFEGVRAIRHAVSELRKRK